MPTPKESNPLIKVKILKSGEVGHVNESEFDSAKHKRVSGTPEKPAQDTPGARREGRRRGKEPAGTPDPWAPSNFTAPYPATEAPGPADPPTDRTGSIRAPRKGKGRTR